MKHADLVTLRVLTILKEIELYKFGTLIFKLRLAHGLSRRYVAAHLEIKELTLFSIEMKRATGSLDSEKVCQIAEFYGIPEKVLLDKYNECINSRGVAKFGLLWHQEQRSHVEVENIACYQNNATEVK